VGDISRWTPAKIRQVIRKSNKQSEKGSQKYVIWENSAIQTDYEFIACPCNENCWCRRHLCAGHYQIKKITFDEFLESYTNLWIPPKRRTNIKNAVRFGTPFNGRERNAVKPLRWLRANWSKVLTCVQGYNKCGLCDSLLPDIVGDVKNLYVGKMWSQLLYDSVVPFDVKSRAGIKRAGYTDPIKDFGAMNYELFNDLKKITEKFRMDVESIRNFDSPWDVVTNLTKPHGGQPLSRVLDKMFYTPR
jgi:hypothetical protein